MQIERVYQRLGGRYRFADDALRWGMIAPNAQRQLTVLFQAGYGIRFES